MDVNDEYVTMLTPEGEFVKANHMKESYEIGEEITFFPINERVSNTSKQRFFQVKKWRYALASSLVAILLLSLFIPFSPRNEVYAYMSIDINPSFEVGLDENLRVVSLEALNDEAKKLLESMPDWKNSTLDSITEKIIQHSKNKGYLEDGKQVLITTVVTDTHDTDVDRELEHGIKEIKEEYEKEQIAVTTVTSTVETRKAAKEKGISTGKLLIEQNKVPKRLEKKKPQPVEKSKENQQANEQKEINEFKNNNKQRAEEVKEELKEKKEQIKEKVKTNIENSHMPDHIKDKKFEKIEENWEKKQQKQEEKERKKEEKRQIKEKQNRGNSDHNRNHNNGNNHKDNHN